VKSLIIIGRGGDGIKTVGEMVSECLVEQKYYILGCPKFGPERRGAVVYYFIKFSKNPILDRTLNMEADYAVLMEKDFDHMIKNERCIKIIPDEKFITSDRHKLIYYLIGRFIRVTGVIDFESMKKRIYDKFLNMELIKSLEEGHGEKKER